MRSSTNSALFPASKNDDMVDALTMAMNYCSPALRSDHDERHLGARRQGSA